MNASTIWLKHLIPAFQAIQAEIVETERLQSRRGEQDKETTSAEITKRAEGAPPRLLRVPEAAVLLGLKASTIYKLVCERKLPFYKVGSRTMFKEKQLLEWVERFAVPTIGEPPRQRRRPMP